MSKTPQPKMTIREKAIYINAGLALGCALELYWGRSLLVVALSAVLLFTVANGTLLFRKRADRPPIRAARRS